MNAFPRFLLAIAGLAAAPALLSAASFEGAVRMKVGDPRGESHTFTQHIKNGVVRTDMEMQGRTMSVILNMNTREMTMLMPEQHMYMVHAMPDPSQAAGKEGEPSDATLEKTGETEKILGYLCTKYVVHSKGTTTDVWLTEELGRFAGFGNGPGPFGMGRRARPPKSAWELALAGKDFFPLRVVSHSADGNGNFQMEVLSIDRASQPDSLFTPPEGYRKFDMGAMMQGLGGMHDDN